MIKSPLKYIVLVIFVVVVGAGFAAWFILFRQKPVVVPVAKHVPIHHFAYKINIDSLVVHYDQVDPNENLSSILSPLASAQLIDRISKETRDVFDVRKIRAGQPYAWITKKSGGSKALYFIYEINDIDYVVYDLRDSLRAWVDHKDVVKKIKSVSGTIYSSL